VEAEAKGSETRSGKQEEEFFSENIQELQEKI